MNESTKMDFRYRRIGQLSDVSDLAENAVSGKSKSAARGSGGLGSDEVDEGEGRSDMANAAERNGVSRRTLERTRAKMKRLRIIEYLSRFSMRNNYRDGWTLSSRFENSLCHLAVKIENLKNSDIGSHEKDDLLIQLANALRVEIKQNQGVKQDEWNEG